MTDARPDQPTITVQGGPIDGYVLTMIPGEAVVVGNGRQARLRIEYPEFAFTHLKITWDDLGVWITDMAARGTWLNGEPIQAAPLSHGDVVRLADPDKHPKAPFLRIGLPQALEVPEGTMPSAELLGGGTVGEPPPSAPPRGRTAPPSAAGRRAAGRRPRAFRTPGPMVLATAAVGLVALVAVLFLARALLSRNVTVDAVRPAAAEPGQSVTISGSRFAVEASGNTIWFGDVPAAAESGTADSVQVKVPANLPPGEAALSVQTARGRSRPARFRVLSTLRAVALDPAGAVGGDEVVLQGIGFAPGVAVSVGPAPAEVLSVAPTAVRFRVPALTAAPGSSVAVVATVEGRSTTPLGLVLARLPFLVSVAPPRAMPGEIVRLKGIGFAPSPEANEVTFGAVPGLVVASSSTEIAVVAPPVPGAQAENPAPVVVAALGRTSAPLDFTLLRIVEGSWLPRCVAQPAGPGAAPGQVLVGVEIAPLLLLSAKDDAPSTARRALAVCEGIDSIIGRARIGERPVFEARDGTASSAVAVVGRTDVLVRVTAEDAAAYARPPGGPERNDKPAPAAVARLWAALLNDLVTVTTGGGTPSASAALSPAAGRAFADLRAGLPWQYGEGVSNARVAALRPDLRRRLREAALSVP